jgi:ferredoxin-thioredoxin reductase catalytic subunit/rubredoxin
VSAAVPVAAADIEKAYEKIKKDAGAGGYRVNPDADFARGLVSGLLVNQQRYGYPSCPCRLAGGNKDEDLDIICPCDYRDQDVVEHGACYCALYVSQDVLDGKRQLTSIPERRPPRSLRKKVAVAGPAGPLQAPLPVWRCRVCGYLCARDGPPEICPICKAKKERFERFQGLLSFRE